MAARLIRRYSAHGQHHRSALSHSLAAAVLLVVWLIVISAAAGVEPPLIPFPGGPNGRIPAEFDAQRFFETFLVKAAGNIENNELLDKVEISWNEESRMSRELLDGLKKRLTA